VLGSGGPFDVLKITIAARLAGAEGGKVRFVHVLDENASKAQIRSLERFHAKLGELCRVPTESVVIQSEDVITALSRAVEDADLAIIGSSRGHRVFTALIENIIDHMAIPVLLVRVAERKQPLTARGVFDRLVTGRLQFNATRR
jgi:nucleotide-binding universal stress UspA family protein